MRIVYTILTVLLFSAAAFAEPVTVTTLAGSEGGSGYRDGTGSDARFDSLFGIAVDPSGNILVADASAHNIRQITPSGVVTTFAGVAGESGIVNGKRGVARFTSPYGLAFDGSGNLYVAEEDVRRISPSGAVTTLLAGAPTSFGVAADSSGNVFLTDLFGDRILKITPGGSATTFASTADAPHGLTIDTANNLYFTTQSNGVYKCTPQGVVTPIATITYPGGIDVDAAGNLYVTGQDKVHKITPAGVVTDFAGSFFGGYQDGTGTASRFSYPRGAALSPDGTVLYVTDQLNHAVRRITVPGAVVTTLAGRPNEYGSVNGTGPAARFFHPSDVVLAPDGNLYVTDAYNSRIRKITPAGVTTTFAGSTSGNADGTGTAARFDQPSRIAYGYDGAEWFLYVTDLGNDNVRRITQAGVVTTIATGVDGALGVAAAADGDVYVSEFYGHAIRRIDMPSATVTVFAGATGQAGDTNATGTAARFENPAGLTVDGSGNLFVADQGNNLIRKIVLATAEVTTLAGSGMPMWIDGTGTAASFIFPQDVHAVGSDLYVADAAPALRLIEPGAVVTTVAGRGARWVHRDGTGDLARFLSIGGIGGDSNTNLYITSPSANNVRKVRVPGIADAATVSDPTPALQTVVQLETDPDTATSWTWSVDRRPAGSTAELSSTTVRNPTFVPDVAELYTFLLRAEGPGGIRYSTVNATPLSCADPLATVVASAATAGVCVTGTNGTASVSITGGGGSTVQWGYRTTSGGAITPLAGETASTYAIDGTDLGGTGARWLVVTVTPACGVPTVSNEVPIEVTAVPDATVTASTGVFAGSTQNFASVADPGTGATYAWGITNGTITSGQGTRSIAYTAGASGTVALTVTVSRYGCAANGNANVPVQTRSAGATMLYIVTPCRIVDTRGGAAIANNETRDFVLAGVCGIPADAQAVVANVTAVGPVTDGWLALWPSGTPWGGTSTMNYRTGRTRANNAVISLPNDGEVSVLNAGGPQHILIDVTGYFR